MLQRRLPAGVCSGELRPTLALPVYPQLGKAHRSCCLWWKADSPSQKPRNCRPLCRAETESKPGPPSSPSRAVKVGTAGCHVWPQITEVSLLVLVTAANLVTTHMGASCFVAAIGRQHRTGRDLPTMGTPPSQALHIGGALVSSVFTCPMLLEGNT